MSYLINGDDTREAVCVKTAFAPVRTTKVIEKYGTSTTETTIAAFFGSLKN